MIRRKTKMIQVGNVKMGGGEPVSVQSMTNTDTRDVCATVSQILRLEKAGCDVVRVAVPDMQAAEKISEIKSGISVPLVCDIHFDYKTAIKCIEQGADKIRINPGNIGNAERVKVVAEAAKEYSVPIRIGVNAGSTEKDILEKYRGATAEAMVESAIRHVILLEDVGFTDIVISLKASNVLTMIKAYEILSEKYDYPLHLGVTEAGTPYTGTIKSAVGIGALLANGIGDTIRVSLTGAPEEEVRAGIEILKSLDLRFAGVTLISCPTCGRCQVDLIHIAEKVEKALVNCRKNIKVAVMGCAVNGPGEAKEADIGIAGGKGSFLMFKKGVPVGKYDEKQIVEILLRGIESLE